MKITKLECIPLDFKLKEPYTIAYETVSSCQNVILKIETDTGIIGWGCAAPDAYITKESDRSVIDFFEKVIEPILHNNDPFNYIRHLELAKSKGRNHASALAMMDMALYDIISKKADVPLYKLLGGFKDNIKTSITIGILSIEETIQKAREFTSQGFDIIKLKGGIDYQEDIEKILKLRETFGSQIELRFDANQGYSVDDTLKFIEAVSSANLEIIEQPTIKEKIELLGQITEKVSIPVMADEGLMTLHDAFRLVSNELIDMINIKIMKVGGILEALYINSVAKSDSVESMVGCMDECALGISAGLHFALSRPNIVYADLDSHLDIINDPFQGLVMLKNGVLYPSELPGLGVTDHFKI